jgi:hypothetical protein
MMEEDAMNFNLKTTEDFLGFFKGVACFDLPVSEEEIEEEISRLRI